MCCFLLVKAPQAKRKKLAQIDGASPPKCNAPSEELRKHTSSNHYERVPVYYHHLAVLIHDELKEDKASENSVFEKFEVNQARLQEVMKLFSELNGDYLHYDFKPFSYEQAFEESICYFISAHQDGNKYVLAFGLPCTCNEIGLVLYMSGNGPELRLPMLLNLNDFYAKYIQQFIT